MDHITCKCFVHEVSYVYVYVGRFFANCSEHYIHMYMALHAQLVLLVSAGWVWGGMGVCIMSPLDEADGALAS